MHNIEDLCLKIFHEYELGLAKSIEIHGELEGFRFHALILTWNSSYILKKVSPNSTMSNITIADADVLCSHLESCNFSTIVSPLKSKTGKYVVEENSARFCLYNYFNDYKILIREEARAKYIIDVADRVYRDFSNISQAAKNMIMVGYGVERLMGISQEFISEIDSIDGVSYLLYTSFFSEYEKIIGLKNKLGLRIFSSVSHGDLNLSNIIESKNFGSKVVDIDNICVGSPYSDRLFSLILYGANCADFIESLEYKIEDAFGFKVEISEDDFVVSALYVLGWYGFVRHQYLSGILNRDNTLDALHHFSSGLQGMLECYKIFISKQLNIALS